MEHVNVKSLCVRHAGRMLRTAPCALRGKPRSRRTGIGKQASRRACLAHAASARTEQAYESGFVTDCGKWYLRKIKDEDVPAVAHIQTDAFHEQFAFQPMDATFKSFFRVCATVKELPVSSMHWPKYIGQVAPHWHCSPCQAIAVQNQDVRTIKG